jgi:hypothetical protein
MNKRIAAAAVMVGSLVLGPAASAAPEPASGPGYGLESVDGILDHGKDDHDHDGDGRPDHDPEDHDDDDSDKPEPEDDDD